MTGTLQGVVTVNYGTSEHKYKTYYLVWADPLVVSDDTVLLYVTRAGDDRVALSPTWVVVDRADVVSAARVGA